MSLLTQDELNAIHAALAPTSSNPFITLLAQISSLDGLNDVNVSSPLEGQFLRFDGVNFVNEFIQLDDVVAEAVTQHASEIEHNQLKNLGMDYHPQYMPVNALRSFSNPVGGVFPTSGQHLTTKEYVDIMIPGLKPKYEAAALADENQDIFNIRIIDRYNPVGGERVLLLNQDDPIENGIWIMKAGPWERPADFAAGDPAEAALISITNGNVYKGTKFVCVTPASVIGTDPITFTYHDGPAQIIAGKGLIKTGNRIDIRAGNAIGLAEDLIFVQQHEIDHGSLNPITLNEDHHKLYILKDGTRSFTGPVKGKTPTHPLHLATKQYVDQNGGGGGLSELIVDALEAASGPSSSNPFITLTKLYEAITLDQQAAMDSANSPSVGNPFATIADLTIAVSGSIDTVTCPADTVVGDMVYVVNDYQVARSGNELNGGGIRAEAFVIEKVDSTTCKIEWLTNLITGLSALGFSGGDNLYLAESTSYPNIKNTFPSEIDNKLYQRVGKMLNSDIARILINPTEIE